MNKIAGMLRITLLLAAITAAHGCIDYRLGSTLPPGIRTVYVPVFINRSGEPQIEADTTVAAIQEFQKDGSLAVADSQAADAVLEVTITKVELEPVRFEKDNVKAPAEYRLRIDADLTFKDQKSGAVLVTRKVFGESSFMPAGDLATAKRAATPAATRDLAHEIVKSVVEFW